MGELAGVWSRFTDIELAHASGCWITAADGTRFLDFTSGIGVTSTGHCHPSVVAAICEQARRAVHAQVNCYRHPLLAELADALDAVTPGSIDTFFFSNSGAEAVEAAVKLARRATGRTNLIVFDGAFHGRTALTMAMGSSRVVARSGCQPLPAGIAVAPYPQDDTEIEASRCIAALERILVMHTAPEETAAVFVEPVLGEGGYLVPSSLFLRELRAFCDRYGLLLVADEVQSGVGRTGRFFAFEHAGVAPDVVVMAKGLASGFPMSAIGASAALMAHWPPGTHGGTYGGNPMGCAAALATLEVIRSERLLENARVRGQHLLDGLHRLKSEFPAMREVRGVGLMAAIDLHDDRNVEHARARVLSIIEHCREQSRLLVLPVGPWATSIRLMPPLVVDDCEVAHALEALRYALESAAHAYDAGPVAVPDGNAC